ncbi:YIP1 family protein [Cytobacillus purgationiresistens]|uniref:Yip1 domain-containing protein n=1 Tax=Cytobacillus purgationiresistens TaxID=863449 RepID=A0ABU0AU24_9BACI|nr:YIP1 family protein [Cytobacillus purgationiresistens]MDQ0273530.1 hypothetical protein [Cytobacillus purgationiresistens]
MDSEKENQLERPSLWGMIWSPNKQFDRIKQNPTVWVPLIITSLMFSVGMFFVSTLIEKLLIWINMDAMEEWMIVLWLIRTIIVGTGLFIPTVIILILSAIHLIITKVIGTEVTFKQLFSMNAHILFIGALGFVIGMSIYAFVFKETGMSGKLVAITLLIIYQYFVSQAFIIWQIILGAIGLQRIGKLSKVVAWTIAIILMVISLSFGLFGALLGI